MQQFRLTIYNADALVDTGRTNSYICLCVLLLVVFDCSVVPYLAEFGVKSKVVVLSVFILRLLLVTHS